MRLMEKDTLYFELYDALAHFMGRQHLTVQAVIDQGVNPADLVKGVGGWYDKTSQVGKWGKDWKFFFHGGGCCITNLDTGEPIDWNGPDPQSFDPYFFIRHLEWRLSHESRLPLLQDYIQQHGSPLAIADLIKDLIADGIISPDYHLTPSPAPASPR